MRDMLDSNGEIISSVSVIYCRLNPEANVITSQTAGGSWLIQTVGTPAWKASVQIRVAGLAVLLAMKERWALGETVTVRCDGMAYTGVIEKNLTDKVIRLGPAASRVFEATFTLLVNSEEAE